MSSEELSNEEILNIILNEEPISVECSYELDTDRDGDVDMNIKCVFKFKNDISVFYKGYAQILAEDILDTEEEERVTCFNSYDYELSSNQSIDLSYESLDIDISKKLYSRFHDISMNQNNYPLKEEFEDYIEGF